MLTKLELIHKNTEPGEKSIENSSMSQVYEDVLTDIWMDLGEIGWGRIRMIVRLGVEMQLYEDMGAI